MNKCVKCGSLNQDDESKCGVCGANLPRTDIPSGSKPRLIENPLPQREKKLSKTGMIVLVFGLGLTVFGTVGVFFIGSLGLAILIAGLFSFMVGADSFARNQSRSTMHMMGGAPSMFPRKSGGRSISSLKEIMREEAEERDRESGATD